MDRDPTETGTTTVVETAGSKPIPWVARKINRRAFLTTTAGAGAALAALYVAPKFNTVHANAAFEGLTGPPCIWDTTKFDFEEYPDGGGTSDTYSGQRIDNEYALWGIAISTNHGSSNPAMIFDSTAAHGPAGHVTGGDHDLRTPSVSGGHTTQAFGNTDARHMVLIISEDNDATDPDDRAGGGEIYFDFSVPIAVTYVDILDMDDGNSTYGSGRAKLWNGTTLINRNGNTSDPLDVNRYKFPPKGNNSLQRIYIHADDQVAITRLEIEFNHSGAIAEIGFKCP